MSQTHCSRPQASPPPAGCPPRGPGTGQASNRDSEPEAWAPKRGGERRWARGPGCRCPPERRPPPAPPRSAGTRVSPRASLASDAGREPAGVPLSRMTHHSLIPQRHGREGAGATHTQPLGDFRATSLNSSGPDSNPFPVRLRLWAVGRAAMPWLPLWVLGPWPPSSWAGGVSAPRLRRVLQPPLSWETSRTVSARGSLRGRAQWRWEVAVLVQTRNQAPAWHSCRAPRSVGGG